MDGLRLLQGTWPPVGPDPGERAARPAVDSLPVLLGLQPRLHRGLRPVTAEASATEETAEPGGARAALPRHARPPNWPVSVLRTARPRQWPKNLLVFAAPLAGATWGRPYGALYALVAAFAFCCASVAVYFINDVVDAERDRRHPRKRYRPVAAGDLPKSHALVIGVICAAVGLAAGLASSVPLLTVVIGTYLGISFLY